jgi:Leucine-rich repeat (LRR) protein
VIPPPLELIAPRKAGWRAELGEQFMTFSGACPVAFSCLTGLSLTSLEFRQSNLRNLIGACDKLKKLSLAFCRLVGRSVLKIDVPNSIINKLELLHFKCTRIDLVSVPKLTDLLFRSRCKENPPLRFGYVPELLVVNLAYRTKAWQVPFALSKFFSMKTRSLSKLYLSFASQMVT